MCVETTAGSEGTNARAPDQTSRNLGKPSLWQRMEGGCTRDMSRNDAGWRRSAVVQKRSCLMDGLARGRRSSEKKRVMLADR